MDMRGQLEPGRRQAYALAGKATFTLQNPKTGTRFTYRLTKSDGDKPVIFVAVLTGSDNTNDYRYMGIVGTDGKFRFTGKSKITASAPSAIAFLWFMDHMEDARVDVWHEGVCGRCGRKLTVPESVQSGIGPVCEGRD